MNAPRISLLAAALNIWTMSTAADGPRLNELLPNAPQGWLELANPSATPADLSGCEIRLPQSLKPQSWKFGPDSELGPGSFLLLSQFTTGLRFPAAGGRVELWSAQGTLLDALDYGPQVPAESIGRVGAGWVLLAAPSPGSENGPAAPLSNPTEVRLNEWLLTSPSQPGWIELFNPGQHPVNLAGLQLADRVLGAGAEGFTFAPLSLIEPLGWCLFEADPAMSQSPWNSAFDLGRNGNRLRFLGPDGTALDEVSLVTVSPSLPRGRLPDGGEFVATLSRETRGGPNQSDFDTDGDGMGDGWEVRYQLAPADPSDAPVDSDGDGLSNLEEFLAGRNPRADDPPIPLLTESLADGGFRLRFSALANTTYSILSGEAPDMLTELFVPFIADGPARSVEITDAPLQNRFYRLVSPARSQ